MKLKIVSKSNIVWNIMIFVVLSAAFFIIQNAMKGQSSSFNISYLKDMFKQFSYIFIIHVICLVTVYNLKKISKFFFLLTVFLVLLENTILLKDDVDKLSIFINSFYIIWSFFFYQILKLEISEPYYYLNYSNYEMFEPVLLNIHCFANDLNNESFRGKIVNWSENGIFVKFDKPVNLLNINKLEVNFNDEVFNIKVKNVSKTNDLLGYGFRIIKSEKKVTEFNWDDLYSILDEMGLEAKLIR